MPELRKERRVPTKEWAKIILPDERVVLNCTILNTSPNGAKLMIGRAKVPDQFMLYRKKDMTVRPAFIRTRVGETVGVSLDAALSPDLAQPILEILI